MEKLLELGFKKIGFWKKSEKILSFELSEFSLLVEAKIIAMSDLVLKVLE